MAPGSRNIVVVQNGSRGVQAGAVDPAAGRRGQQAPLVRRLTAGPLLYLAGIAAAGGEGADVLVEGHAYGSLSVTSYTVGARCPPDSAVTAGAAALDSDVPPSAVSPVPHRRARGAGR